ncbi:MAG: hypothetical protein HC859_04510 [Bacteroidia bacterium]|nr:hypothetical protein [Bacteroidia bacterium]
MMYKNITIDLDEFRLRNPYVKHFQVAQANLDLLIREERLLKRIRQRLQGSSKNA